MDKKEKFREASRGSYTVEAAIWTPVFLFLLLFAIGAGIRLYREVETPADDGKELWAVSIFYQERIAEEKTDE